MQVHNAIIRLKVIFTSNGMSKEFMARNGQVIYSAELNSNSHNNSNSSYHATVQASAPGYISRMETTTSSSTSTSTSIMTSKSKSG